jgi:branched-chain amino acid transport system permease protein
MTKSSRSILAAAAVLVCAGVPFVLDPENSYFVYYLFMVFTYVAMAQGFNIIAGYTGQVSLGQHAFFGLGAYVTVFAWELAGLEYFNPLAMLLAGLIPAMVAMLIGIPLLSKLRGDYFSLGTLGLGEILRVIFIQGRGITGGSMGKYLPSGNYTSMYPYYFTALFLAAAATFLVYYFIRSRIGIAFVAIREDETAASATGINVLWYKLIAFGSGAFITGICGSIQAYYLFHIHPQNFFGLTWTLYPILMCVLGGNGTLVGPVAGALILTGVFELAKMWLPEIHPIISGALIIFAILFLPNGIVGLKIRKHLPRPGGSLGKPF